MSSDASPSHEQAPCAHYTRSRSLFNTSLPATSYQSSLRYLRNTTAFLTTTCATAQTADEIGEALLEYTCTVLATPGAALVLRDPTYGDAVVRLACGAWEVRRGMRLPAGTGLCGHVLTMQQPYICHPARCTTWCEWPWLIACIYSIVGIPLIHEQVVYGVLMLGCESELANEHIYFLTEIGRLVASAFARVSWADKTDHAS
jgi:GAF domain-containing protein